MMNNVDFQFLQTIFFYFIFKTFNSTDKFDDNHLYPNLILLFCEVKLTEFKQILSITQLHDITFLFMPLFPEVSFRSF